MLTTPPVEDPYQPALGRIKSNAGLVGASIKGRWLLYRLKVVRRIIILYQKLQRTYGAVLHRRHDVSSGIHYSKRVPSAGKNPPIWAL